MIMYFLNNGTHFQKRQNEDFCYQISCGRKVKTLVCTILTHSVFILTFFRPAKVPTDTLLTSRSHPALEAPKTLGRGRVALPPGFRGASSGRIWRGGGTVGEERSGR